MHSFAHSLSHPLARHDAEAATRQEPVHAVIALLVAGLIALMISGALVYNSMTNEIQSLRISQIMAQQQSVQANAFNACLANHPRGATAKCRAAATTFAADEPDPRAFDKALAYIYAR
jgi:cytochrome b561